MNRLFICSPFSGDIEKNTRAARCYCKQAIIKGWAPFAPHLLYPQILDEEIERDKGIGLGLKFLEVCDALWVANPSKVTDGMRQEINFAGNRRIKVICGQLSEAMQTLDAMQTLEAHV